MPCRLYRGWAKVTPAPWAAVPAGVYGIFSLTGEEHPEGLNPYNTLIMITDQGEINLVYRKMFPWTPVEPWTAGHETAVAVGPKVRGGEGRGGAPGRGR